VAVIYAAAVQAKCQPCIGEEKAETLQNIEFGENVMYREFTCFALI